MNEEQIKQQRQHGAERRLEREEDSRQLVNKNIEHVRKHQLSLNEFEKEMDLVRKLFYSDATIK